MNSEPLMGGPERRESAKPAFLPAPGGSNGGQPPSLPLPGQPPPARSVWRHECHRVRTNVKGYTHAQTPRAAHLFSWFPSPLFCPSPLRGGLGGGNSREGQLPGRRRRMVSFSGSTRRSCLLASFLSPAGST